MSERPSEKLRDIFVEMGLERFIDEKQMEAMRDYEEIPLTDFELLKVFCFTVENDESVAKSFLPESTHLRIDREVAVAAKDFISRFIGLK